MSKPWIVNSFKAIVALLLFGGVLGTAVAEEIKVGTGAPVNDNIFSKVKAPMEAATGVTLNIVSVGPVQALKDLDAGLLDAAFGGLTFPDWMAMMQKEGYAIADPSVYKNRVIGKDIIKVMTNKDVTVTDLSKEQLAAIFTGKTKNWSEVGGPNVPVVVILGSKTPGTQAVFQKQALDGAAFAADAVQGTTADDIKSRLVATSGAISVGTMSQIDSTVNAPTIPEFGRPVTFITKGAPSPGTQKVLDYISGPGKPLMAR